MTAARLVVCLACIIAGEAGNCDVRTQIATAHVAANRNAAGILGGWYGYAAPTETSRYIAQWYRLADDPTHGALMLVSDDDLPLVEPFTRHMRETWTGSQCDNEQRLHAFARQGTP